jgi:hypothetical protein
MCTLMRPLPTLKHVLYGVLCTLLSASTLQASGDAPEPQILSAAMRDGSTIMDIVYRVDDADDASVKVRALAFVDGVRSFANVLRPSSFVEGTEVHLGDSIATGTEHSLAWDVGADWEVDLGEVKFEILCQDDRGLLAFEWTTIPAAEDEPEVTVSKNAPSDTELLDAFFWQYASGDPDLTLTDGVLSGSPNGSVFAGLELVEGNAVQAYAAPYVFKQMGFDATDGYYAFSARAPLQDLNRWHAIDRPFSGLSVTLGWGGENSNGQIDPLPNGLSEVIALAGGYKHSLALKSDGTVVGWGYNYAATPPASLSGVSAIAAGSNHSLALKNDGTVVAWGSNSYGQASPPADLRGVIALAAGFNFSLAVKSDGSIIGWGENNHGQANPPTDLSGVIALACGERHGLALKNDGTVVGWGDNYYGQANPPVELSQVTAIAAGSQYSLALKSDGTVVAWGINTNGQATPPVDLNGVIALAAGDSHNLALQSDGSIVAWGYNSSGQTSLPADLREVSVIGAGAYHSLAVQVKAE